MRVRGFYFFQFLFVAGVLTATACTTAPAWVEEPLDPVAEESQEKANDVTLKEGPISGDLLSQYKEVGPIQCDVFWRSAEKSSSDVCRSILRGVAVEKHATMVVIEEKIPQHCETNFLDDAKRDCITMKAKAYRML